MTLKAIILSTLLLVAVQAIPAGTQNDLKSKRDALKKDPLPYIFSNPDPDSKEKRSAIKEDPLVYVFQGSPNQDEEKEVAA